MMPEGLCKRARFALVAWLFAGAVSAEVIDRVLAVVAGQLIMMSDVTAARELRLVPLEGIGDPVGSVLSKLIDRELMLAEVDRYAPPEPTADAVDREVASVRARFPSAEAFEATLARSGFDDAHLRQTLRENLRILAYLDQRFTPPSGVAGGEERRQILIDEWVAGLRRRADVIDLYLPGR